MNQRSWIWVGLFGGMAVVLLSWLLLSDTDPVEEQASASGMPAVTAPEAGDGVKAKLKVRKIDLDPEMLHVRRGKLPNRLSNNPALLQMRANMRKRPGIDQEAGEDKRYPLDSEGIAQAVEARRRELVGCYETAKLHTPELSASLVLSLGIEPDASGGTHVTSVETDAAQDGSVLEECLASVFGEIAFSGSEATTVQHPVDLSP